MTETDILGRTEEEIQRDREEFRGYVNRVRARDWHEVPRGFYAIPIEDYDAWDDDSPEDSEPPIIGYRQFERKVARICKNGRRIGRDAFVTGKMMVMPDVHQDRIFKALDFEKECLPEEFGPNGWSKSTIDRLVLDVEGDDTFRPTFGKLTGRCGCCGKTLTDPTSKMLGIGPDCRGYRRAS